MLEALKAVLLHFNPLLLSVEYYSNIQCRLIIEYEKELNTNYISTMRIFRQIMFYYGTKNTGIGGEGGGKQQGQNYPTKYDNHSV